MICCYWKSLLVSRPCKLEKVVVLLRTLGGYFLFFRLKNKKGPSYQLTQKTTPLIKQDKSPNCRGSLSCILKKEEISHVRKICSRKLYELQRIT